MKSLNVPAEIRTESAWILFENKDVLETEFTDKIYEHLKKEEGLETVTDLYFENKLKDDANRFTLPQVYQGFYDNREIGVIDDFGSLTTSTSTITAAELFTTDNASITKKDQCNPE